MYDYLSHLSAEHARLFGCPSCCKCTTACRYRYDYSDVLATRHVRLFSITGTATWVSRPLDMYNHLTLTIRLLGRSDYQTCTLDGASFSSKPYSHLLQSHRNSSSFLAQLLSKTQDATSWLACRDHGRLPAVPACPYIRCIALLQATSFLLFHLISSSHQLVSPAHLPSSSYYLIISSAHLSSPSFLRTSGCRYCIHQHRQNHSFRRTSSKIKHDIAVLSEKVHTLKNGRKNEAK